MARTRYHFAEHDRPHFLTDTVVEWLPVFTRPETAQVLFDSWTWLQANAGLRLYGFVLLENHLHAVAQASDLPGVWQRFKSFTAKRLIEVLETAGARQLLDRMGRVGSPVVRPACCRRAGRALHRLHRLHRLGRAQ